MLTGSDIFSLIEVTSKSCFVMFSSSLFDALFNFLNTRLSLLHIWDTNCSDNPESALWDTLFPADCQAENQKSFTLRHGSLMI